MAYCSFVYLLHGLLLKKPLTAAPKRLQGMLLCLQKFNLEVGYKKGAEMFLVDTLSIAPLPRTAPPTTCLRQEHEELCSSYSVIIQ